MVVNDDAEYLKQRGAFQFFASKLAPTDTAELSDPTHNLS